MIVTRHTVMSRVLLQHDVFQERNTEGFEIAFTALLCTVVLQLPAVGPVSESLLSGAVLSLITVALIRFMASSSDYRSNKSIIYPTQIIIETITIGAIVYIQFMIILQLDLPLYLIYSLVVLFPIALIFTHDFLFGDLFVYYAAIAYDLRANLLESNSEPQSLLVGKLVELLGVFLEQALLVSRAELPLRLLPLDQFIIADEIQSPKLSSIVSLFLVMSTILLVPLAGLYFLAGASLVQMLVTIWMVVYLRLIVRFWYVAYGLSQDLVFSLSKFLGEVTLYALMVFVIFEWT